MGVDRLRIKTSAAKELDAISRDADRRRVAARIRQGRFRVIYSIDDRARIVVVFRIEDRKSVYR